MDRTLEPIRSEVNSGIISSQIKREGGRILGKKKLQNRSKNKYPKLQKLPVFITGFYP